MEKSNKIMWIIVIGILAIFLGNQFGLFTIGTSGSQYSACSNYLPEATLGAVAGECYVHTDGTTQSTRYVVSVFDRQTTSGPMCEANVAPVTSGVSCFNNKVYTAVGTLAGFCTSNADCSGTICTNNFCSTRLVNECNTPGSRICSGAGYKECQSNNLWTNELTCPSNTACTNGLCTRLCTDADWTSGISPTVCPSSGKQTKIWNKINVCTGGVQKTNEQISCVYINQTNQNLSVCNYSYSTWSTCSNSTLSQTRNATALNSPCNGSPVLIQECKIEENFLNKYLGYIVVGVILLIVLLLLR